MHKIVINVMWGGFGFSKVATEWMRENAEKYELTQEQLNSLKTEYPSFDDMNVWPRHSKIFIDCIEALGEGKASGGDAELEVVEIKGNRYKLREFYDAEEVFTPEDEDWVVI